MAPAAVPTVAIAAVAQERRPDPTPTRQQAIPGGTLIPLAGFDLGHTDPHRNTSVAELSYMAHIFPGILQYDTTTWVDIAPDLAVSWEVDSTGKAYTFKVREGATYSDGTPVTAEDMAYSLNRMIERPNDIAMPRSGCIRGFMENAHAIGPANLQVNLKDPAVGFLGCVASPWISIPPKFILEELDSGSDSGRELELDEIIGAGPFILKNYQRGISFEVERNENYYDQPFPYLDGVRHVVVTDPSSRVAAFRTGHAHKEAVFPAFGADDDIAIRQQMGDQLFVSESVGFGVGGIHINLRNAPFDDARVRKALQLAVDREAMIELTRPADGQVQCYYPCIFDWIYSVEEYMQFPGFRFDKHAEDVEEAKRLLAEAGYPDGFEATITFRKVGPYPDYSAIVAQHWKDIGIDLTLMAAMGPSLTAVIIAIRTVRSVALSVKSSQYSEAARAIGASDWRIMLYHITPNCMAPVIVVGSAVLGGAIVTEASLSFLGLGVPPNIPTWGNMLGQSQERYIAAGPWTSVFPGLALTITAFGINLLGDALRDILDPRLRGSR